MSKSFLDEGTRANAFYAKPGTLFLVGRDVDPALGRPHKEGEHVLFQDRALIPDDDPEIVKLAKSIRAKGMVVPILFDKDDDDRACIADGRRREIAARLVRKWAEDAGEPSPEFLYVPSRKRGAKSFNAGQAVSVKAVANKLRQDTTVSEDIKCAMQMLDNDVSPQDTADAFGITIDHLESVWRPLAKATKEVMALLDAKTITMAEGARLMKMKSSERLEALAKVTAAVEENSREVKLPSKSKAKAEVVKKKKTRAAVQKALGKAVKPKTREVRKIVSNLGELVEHERGVRLKARYEDARGIIQWMLGEGDMPAWLEGE